MLDGRIAAVGMFSNDVRNLQQYCSIEHYQSGRTKVYDSVIVIETYTMFIHSPNKEILFIKWLSFCEYTVLLPCGRRRRL